MKQSIKLKVNGSEEELYVEPFWSLSQVLREQLGLTGIKIGCDTGECGTCTVLIDGKPVRSCLMPAMKAVGKDILTIEGLKGDGGGFHPVQTAFMEHFALQCGYCTPGMILTAKALLDENPEPTEEEIKAYLNGNLCRCTGYGKIVEAVLAAKNKVKQTRR